MRSGAAVTCAVLALWLAAGVADGKELKYSSPGRTIYKSTETVGSVLDQNRRKFVIEAALGNGPEGNLGVTLGWLVNRPQGFELYAGFGTRMGPVVHHTLSTRYFLPFVAFRGYVGGGYIFQRSPRIGVWSHSAFGDVGYKWIIRRTYQVTVGVGLQRYVERTVRPGSVFETGRVDQERFLGELDKIRGHRYLFAVRLSRAF